MSDVKAEFADDGEILQRGDVDTNPEYTPKGSVDVVAGIYVQLNDGTVAGPMEYRLTNGDVFKWFGKRHVVNTLDEQSEAILLGNVWLDSKGNAHSDPSPLDAKIVYDNSLVFW